MGFGFFGKRTAHMTFNSKGSHNAGVTTTRDVTYRVLNFQQIKQDVLVCMFQYDPANTGNLPDQQNIIGVSGPFITYNPATQKGEFRSTTSGILTGHLFRLVDTPRGFRWATQADVQLSPTRAIKFTIFRPDLVQYFQFVGVSTVVTNSIIDGSFDIPYLPACKQYYFSRNYLLTNLNGAWSPSADHIGVFQCPSVVIQRKFPQTLKGLFLACQGGLDVGTNINTLVADCVLLESFMLLQRVNGGSTANATLFPASTTLQLGHMTVLKYIHVQGANITNIVYDSGISLSDLILQTCTALNNTTFQALLNNVMASNTQLYVNVSGCNQAMTRTFVDADFKSTLTEFFIGGNRISGTGITLTTARPNLLWFSIGNSAGGVIAANKNNFPTVNISGVTNATNINLTNSQIGTLTLPNNSVCTTLQIGGNKLDAIVQANLFTEIAKLTGLTICYFNAGGATPSIGSDTGQDSTNGLGANVDFTSFLPSGLILLGIVSCKATGTITVQSGIQNLFIQDNNIVGISGAGSFAALVDFQAGNNPNFIFDYTRVPAVQRASLGGTSGNNSAQVHVDFSNRTSTADWSSFAAVNFINCLVLTTVTFPTTQARFRHVPGPSAAITITNCPLLTSLPNLENANWSQLTSNARVISLQSNALNVDLKIGYNNFLPTSISLQNNGMSQAIVDVNIMNVVNNRTKWNTTTVAKALNISGSNAAPSGASVTAPTGYRTHAELTVTAVSKANPGVVTVSNIGTIANGDVVYFYDVLGMTELNGNYYKVAGISGNTFQLQTTAGANVDTTSYGTFTSGKCRPDGDIPAGSVKQAIYMMTNQYVWAMTTS